MSCSLLRDFAGLLVTDSSSQPTGTPASERGERLDSWKGIAAYLDCSVRTVQRWERLEGLPVHRHQHDKLASIYAFSAEIDAWRSKRSAGGSAAPAEIDATQAQPSSLTSESGRSGEEAVPPSGAGAREDPMARWRDEMNAVREELATVWQGTPAFADSPSSDPTPWASAIADLGVPSLRHPVLESAVERVVGGRGATIGIEGEPGAGKTTLVDALLEAMRDRAVVVARGACSERLGSSEVYLPWLEVVEGLVGGHGGDGVARLLHAAAPTWYLRSAPLWAAAHPDLAPLVEQAKAASPERIKRELALFLEELAAIRPVVLFVDDMHWADPSTVALLSYLSSALREARVLILVAYRGTELRRADHGFVAARADLLGRGVFEEVEVAMLTQGDISDHLERSYPGLVASADLAEVLHDRTEGNPLFLMEILRDLVRDGTLAKDEKDGKTWCLTKHEAGLARRFPSTVRSMVDHRIAQLDERELETLGFGAVQGVEFDSAVVAAAMREDPGEVEAILAGVAERFGLVRPAGDGLLPAGSPNARYGFVHVLFQNALYDRLTPSARSEAARRVAEAVMVHYHGELPAHAADLALLYETALQFDPAARWLVQAARNAAGLFAHDEALDLCERAIANAKRVDPADRSPHAIAALRLALALFNATARFADGTPMARRLVNAARSLGDSALEVEALCWVAHFEFYGRALDRCREIATEALRLAERHGDVEGIALAQSVLGRERLCVGDTQAADQLFGAALPVVLLKPDRPLGAELLSYQCLLSGWRLHYATVEDLSRRWRELEVRQGQAGAHFHFIVGMAIGNQGRIGEALRLLHEGQRVCEMIDDAFHACRLPNIAGWLHRELGDLATASELELASAKLGESLDFEEAAANAHVNLAETALIERDHRTALSELDAASDLFKRDVWFRWRYNIRLQAGYGEYHLLREDYDAARTSSQLCLDLAEAADAPKHAARALALLARIHEIRDEREEACAVYTRALARLDGLECPTVVWKIAVAAAACFERSGDAATAGRLRDRAAALVRALLLSVDEPRLRDGFASTAEVRALLQR